MDIKRDKDIRRGRGGPVRVRIIWRPGLPDSFGAGVGGGAIGIMFPCFT